MKHIVKEAPFQVGDWVRSNAATGNDYRVSELHGWDENGQFGFSTDRMRDVRTGYEIHRDHSHWSHWTSPRNMFHFTVVESVQTRIDANAEAAIHGIEQLDAEVKRLRNIIAQATEHLHRVHRKTTTDGCALCDALATLDEA